MAQTVDESAFWLPSEFLTDDDLFIMSHQKPQPQPNAMFRRSSSALNSPGESVESSTETENSDDPDEFIAELTRHLAQSALHERAAKPQHHHHHHPQEKWCAPATSPQSTLSGFPGWSNRRPPADDTWELIYAAAERVAKMRLMNQQQQLRRELLNASRTPPARYNASQNNNNNNQIHQMKTQVKQAWLSQQQALHGLPHSSFPTIRPQQHGMRAVFLGGSGPTGVKRQSTGTGVFLPRRVGSNNNNNTPTVEPRKKQGCSTVLLPARVVQALNLNIDEINGHTHTHNPHHTQPQPQPQPHEILVARRNAAMATQQRRGLPLLPQEWTY